MTQLTLGHHDQATMRALTTICRSALLSDSTIADGLLSGGGEWDAVWNLAERERVTSWCFDFVTGHPETIDSGRLASWSQAYIDRVALNKAALKQLAEIVSACEADGIRLIALKGSALLLWLYEDPGCRLLSDIDLLVDENEAAEAVQVLRKLGYAMSPNIPLDTVSWGIQCQLALRWRGHLPQMRRLGSYLLELHLNILNWYGDWTVAKEEIWRDVRFVDYRGTRICCLSPLSMAE